MRSRAVNIGYAASAGKLFRIWMQLCAFSNRGKSVGNSFLFSLIRNTPPDSSVRSYPAIVAACPDNQVALYTDKRYNVHQMEEIRFGLTCGLSMDEVKQYASPEMDARYMFVIRNELSKQKLCVSDPKEFLNQNTRPACKEGD